MMIQLLEPGACYPADLLTHSFFQKQIFFVKNTLHGNHPTIFGLETSHSHKPLGIKLTGLTTISQEQIKLKKLKRSKRQTISRQKRILNR